MDNLTSVDSLFFVIFAALITVLSRAGLNCLDRFSLGYEKVCLVRHAFFSNLFPTVISAFLAYALVGHTLFYKLLNLVSVDLLFFSLTSQLVAYSFSYAFKNLSIKSIAISAKISDLFIIGYIYLLASQDQLTNFLYSIASLLFFLPIALDRLTEIVKNLRSVVFIILALLIQAIAANSLGMTIIRDEKFLNLFLVALLVMIFRLIYSCCIYLINFQKTRASNYDYLTKINVVRTFLTLVTHFGFILASTSRFPIVAFSILSCTTFLSIVISHFSLHESVDKKIGIALFAAVFLISFRSYSYVFES